MSKTFHGKIVPNYLKLEINSIKEFDKATKLEKQCYDIASGITCRDISCSECIFNYEDDPITTRNFLLKLLKKDISPTDIEEDFLL